MTQYLGIITAYGAVAILAWITVLLYPRLIPRTPDYIVVARWREAGLFALSILAAIGINQLAYRYLLAPNREGIAPALVTLLTYSPVLGYAAYRRTRSAMLIPAQGTVQSIAIGLGFAILAMFANYLTTELWGQVPTVLRSLLVDDNADLIVRAAMRSAVVGVFLALVAGGWSNKAALLLAGAAIVLVHVLGLLEGGFSAEWLLLLVIHLAIVLGLVSAILATRNVVWFWPVFTALNLLQLYTG